MVRQVPEAASINEQLAGRCRILGADERCRCVGAAVRWLLDWEAPLA